jgi:sarcosine oxidase subunit beta
MRVIVVGAGIMGLSIAYNLAVRGAEVIVLEARYPGSGLSVRAIGGVHSQWGDEREIKLAKRNRDTLEHLSGKLDFNIPFRQDGYLMLATDDEQLTQLNENAIVQRSLGIKTASLSQEETSRRFPILDTSSIAGGTLSQDDGSIHPFSVVFGYWKGLLDHGGKLLRPTIVKKLQPKGEQIWELETDQGTYEADAFVLATGVGTRSILQSVNLDVPTVIFRHEMLATEPLKFFLKPMIELYHDKMYINQSLRGEIICHFPRSEATTKETRSTLEFLEDAATKLTGIMPSLRAAKVLRSWAGLVETTPNSEPICGNMEFSNLWVALGSSGKGIMLAPIIGELMSEEIINGEPNADLQPYAPQTTVRESSGLRVAQARSEDPV